MAIVWGTYTRVIWCWTMQCWISIWDVGHWPLLYTCLSICLKRDVVSWTSMVGGIAQRFLWRGSEIFPTTGAERGSWAWWGCHCQFIVSMLFHWCIEFRPAGAFLYQYSTGSHGEWQCGKWFNQHVCRVLKFGYGYFSFWGPGVQWYHFMEYHNKWYGHEGPWHARCSPFPIC